MNAERQGTRKRRMDLFIEHRNLMERYVASGMDRFEASAKAFKELTGKELGPKPVEKPKTTPEDIKRIDGMVDSLKDKMFYLAIRWADEKDYEDIADYAAHIKGVLPEGFALTKMTKRPFGFHFTIGTDAVYHYFVGDSRFGWKRIK